MAFKTWQTGVHIQQDGVIAVALDQRAGRLAFTALVGGAAVGRGYR